MVHWWMLVPSGKERIIMSATSKEISKSISTPWYITYHGLEIPLIVMRSIYLSIQIFNIQEEPNLFSDYLICMVGASHPKKNCFCCQINDECKCVKKFSFLGLVQRVHMY